MKKNIFTLLALMACTLMYAETVLIDGLYYSLGTTTAQVVKDQTSGKTVYSAYTAVTIPANVTYNDYTYPVTSIGTSAFEALTNLQSVTLPSTITSIYTDAFYGCTKLGSVNLEDGIVLQAVYQSDTPTDDPSDVVVNPANKAQKLIREGNVYILRDDKLFTITGAKVN